MQYFYSRLRSDITNTVANELGIQKSSIIIEDPNPKIGADLAIPCFSLAKFLKKSPQEIAGQVASLVQNRALEKSEAIAGYANFWIKPFVLAKELESDIRSNQDLQYGDAKTLSDKQIVVEYSDPNPFKVLHAGHLYTSIVGDAIANLFESTGAKVHRVNFGGDVGLHVGKTMWAILQKLGGENPKKLDDIPKSQRAEWMAAAYIHGSHAYDEDMKVHDEIIQLSKKIYEISIKNERNTPLAQIYWTCRKWSYDYFDSFYKKIGTKFEKYYPESKVAELGLETVKSQLAKGVYQKSDGAIIFNGEKYELHNRVFINSEGLPTYETKDTGLIMQKWEDYHFDKSVVITGNEQSEYMKVVLKSIEQFRPELARATSHLTHGIVKLVGGQKMSSRKGNILRATDVLNAAAIANREAARPENPDVELGAVKYAFLKQGIGGDIVYDPKESISLEGNSGPYVQYAAVRVNAILQKIGQTAPFKAGEYDWKLEKDILTQIAKYPDIVSRAAAEYEPHQIAEFAYELARRCNRYYEEVSIVKSDEPVKQLRLGLLYIIKGIYEHALGLLGIVIPSSM